MTLTYRGRKYDSQSYADQAKAQAQAHKGQELNYRGIQYKAE